jgi:hypothetical protein
MENSKLIELQNLQSHFSDKHQEFYGFRPQYASASNWNDAKWLNAQIQYIEDQINGMKDTFAGREELREQGWTIPESDPELAKWATWLQAERDRFLESHEKSVA